MAASFSTSWARTLDEPPPKICSAPPSSALLLRLFKNKPDHWSDGRYDESSSLGLRVRLYSRRGAPLVRNHTSPADYLEDDDEYQSGDDDKVVEDDAGSSEKRRRPKLTATPIFKYCSSASLLPPPDWYQAPSGRAKV